MKKIWLVLTVGLLASVLSIAAGARDTPVQPEVVAGGYFTALKTFDLDAAGTLFARESTVFESGGVEGSWKHYREQHLGPELDAIASFAITKKEPEVTASKDDTLTLVTWSIDYTITLKDNRKIHSSGTVTFVLVKEKGSFKIRHLHWSSRRTGSDP